ncbi:unnamed protein product [Closterium sp. NIES-54]
MVHQILQLFRFRFSSPHPTPLATSHLLSAPPSDESVEPSGPYPELVGCLITPSHCCPAQHAVAFLPCPVHALPRCLVRPPAARAARLLLAPPACCPHTARALPARHYALLPSAPTRPAAQRANAPCCPVRQGALLPSMPGRPAAQRAPLPNAPARPAAQRTSAPCCPAR